MRWHSFVSYKHLAIKLLMGHPSVRQVVMLTASDIMHCD